MVIEHTTPADGNDFADIGFPPEEAENLLLRAKLMVEIIGIIQDRGLRQKQAAELFGVSQLKRGRIDQFTIDSLVNMLAHAGVSLEVKVRAAA